VKKKYYQASISRIEIDRTAGKITVSIFTARPGLLIGKGGTGIEVIKEDIKSDREKMKAMREQRREEHKERIKSVKKLILEKEKFYFENEMVQLREIESKKQQIKYEDNSEYNDYLDGLQDNITIGNITILPSRALYENDYGAYKVGLDEFKDSDE
jgi:hypothetical protein